MNRRSEFQCSRWYWLRTYGEVCILMVLLYFVFNWHASLHTIFAFLWIVFTECLAAILLMDSSLVFIVTLSSQAFQSIKIFWLVWFSLFYLGTFARKQICIISKWTHLIWLVITCITTILMISNIVLLF